MNKKRILAASFMAASLLAPFAIRPAHTLADGFYSQQNNADSADITNWVANSPAKISQNMQSQHIDVNNLNGTRYVIQWGDTLSGISAATGIPVQKIAYDNNIHNINLIYAGDVLILNRDGSAPANWNIYGNGNQVAQTRVTINYTDNSVNFFHFGDNNHVRITNNVVGNDDNNDNGNNSNNSNSKIEYEAPSSAKEGLASAKSADNVASSQQAQSPAVSSNKPVNDDTDTNNQPAGNSKADTAKSNDDNNNQNDASSSSTMSTTDFENKVQDDINQDLNNDGGNSSINFTSYSDDNDSSSSSSSSNGNTTQLYDNDQNFTLKSTKMTDKNAQKLADKIIKRLKSDNKLDDLKNADNVQITISSDDNGFNVNFNVTSQSSSSSSDDQGQQSANNQQADDQNNDDDDD